MDSLNVIDNDVGATSMNRTLLKQIETDRQINNEEV